MTDIETGKSIMFFSERQIAPSGRGNMDSAESSVSGGKINGSSESLESYKQQLSEERAFSSEKIHELDKIRKERDAARSECEDLHSRLNFIAGIVEAAPKPDKNLERFRELLEKDYQDYANQTSFLASEAKALKTLQQVEAQLEQVTRDPEILGKSIIAVGGAFSSGKSSFLNSFFCASIKQKEDLLPVDSEPSTAIASYVLSGERTEITGYTYRGGVVPVSKKNFSMFTRSEQDKFRFNMKRIVSDIVFKTEFVRPYKNICFIDTPGFDPGSNSDLDRNTAVNAISGAQALILCFDVTGGTIRDDSLGFLQDILDVNPDIRIYIVATHADGHPLEVDEEVLDRAEELLESNFINYDGISLYNTKKKFTLQPEEYTAAVRGKTLSEFLKDENENSNRQDNSKEGELLDMVRGVFREYISADDDQIKRSRKRINDLKSVYDRFQYILGKKDELLKELKSRIGRKELQGMANIQLQGADETADDRDAVSQIIEDSIKDQKATLDKATRDRAAAEALCSRFEDCIGRVFNDINVHKKLKNDTSDKASDNEPDADDLYKLGEEYCSGQDYGKALRLLRIAAEKGHAKAQFCFGSMYFNGQGVDRNYAVALKWFKKAAEQGVTDAINNLGHMYRNGLGVKKDYSESLKWYRKSAEHGDAAAQCTLGNMNHLGQGVEQNDAEAVIWYKKSAEQGNAVAQNNLGNCYDDGLGVEQNSAEAVNWYRKAAEQGYAMAQSNLGAMYYYGRGAEQDYAEAFKWYQKSAEQGTASAQDNLGNMYYNGQGVEQNYSEAFKWFQKSADQGNADAQKSIGDLYHFGQGVEKNYAEALKWYQKSADQGNASAQDSLGDMYYNGHGVEQDYAEALKWYQKSAEQGNASSQFSLGSLYRDGHGVEQNYAEAFKWFQKSAEQGLVPAQVMIGLLYFQGQGVKQSYAEARSWFLKSAEHGEPGSSVAMHLIGLMYARGMGVFRSDQDAAEWYRKSAELGYAPAQKKLGDMYYDGKLGDMYYDVKGLWRNYSQAARWYRKSAEQGNSDAQFRLGSMYDKGQGVEQNYVEALIWYRQSAEQGNADAQFSLGFIYYSGHGVEQNYTEAAKWYKKSAEQGNTNAQYYLSIMSASGQGVNKDTAEAVKWYKKSHEKDGNDLATHI